MGMHRPRVTALPSILLYCSLNKNRRFLPRRPFIWNRCPRWYWDTFDAAIPQNWQYRYIPIQGLNPPSFNERFARQKQHRPQLLLFQGVSMLRACQSISFTSDMSSTLDSGEDVPCEAHVVWSAADTGAVTARRLSEACALEGEKKNMKGNHLKSTEVPINDDSVLMHILEQCCTELYRNYIFHPSKPCFGAVRAVNMPLRDPLCQYLIWQPL